VTRLHVLSPGFETPNGRALLYPLIVWSDLLREHGLDCRIFGADSPSLTDCDVLLVDSKFHRARWHTDSAAVVAQFRGWKERCRLVYCDTTDSSGWIQAALLPVVDVYAKAQLIKDRLRYAQPMYGLRPYTDHYHRARGVIDAHPELSQAVTDPDQLSKLRPSWNSGLADYSQWGVRRADVYRHLPLRFLLRFPRVFALSGPSRPIAVSCRFGVKYSRQTVSYQRERLREMLRGVLDTRKLGRAAYFHELRSSKVVVSPFGFGEITLKDFEVFLTGGLLLKPDMSHLETWPNFFQGGETMLTHSWDLSDFVAVLDFAVRNYQELQHLAVEGQRRYRAHTSGPEAGEKFVGHLRSVIA
jgi:hypothetical protein